MQHVFKMQYISLFPKYKGAENSMPKLRKVIGTKTKIYCQANVCLTCILAVPRIIQVTLT